MNRVGKTLCGVVAMASAGLSFACSPPGITELVDLNNDGRKDMIEVTNALVSGMFVRLNNGTGFGERTLIEQVTVESLNVGDVNGDGKVDILYRTGGLVHLNYVAYGKGDGTFNEPVMLE